MKKKHIIWGAILGGLALGVVLMLVLVSVDTYTSTNDSCMRCHYHEEADRLWKQSSHYLNESGVVTDCAACHLPPKEDGVVRYYMVGEIGQRQGGHRLGLQTSGGLRPAHRLQRLLREMP